MSLSEDARHVDRLSDYERQVLSSWSDTHKKSTLMLFVLLALTRGAAWSGDIQGFLAETSAGHLTVDEQSLHRNLRRLEGLNLITHTRRAAPGTGVRRKMYELTTSGERVLAAHLETTMSYLDDPGFLAAVRAGRDPGA
ncbi:PadR family transcriptional regulator [Actinopolyspora saharensis]|uniref:Transcriptional regulator PadR-like family protein n=1 Tax=Actinopolyspora saharensis TaxID=995062 RepID=A0A1H0ZA26_9ACTN|nr:PadR family transcriptional regulator [Actinopolyspora saharensis]SDQ24268.1 Transcriptional regulator PadR-like family protein [Actinopolyspora saharensis]